MIPTIRYVNPVFELVPLALIPKYLSRCSTFTVPTFAAKISVGYFLNAAAKMVMDLSISPLTSKYMGRLRKNKTSRRFSKNFSLRTLMASITICCLLVGWYVVRSQNQRACVKSIIENGGRVIYSYPYKNAKFDAQAKPPGPKWLRDSLGIEFLDRVCGIDFSNQNISELPDLANVSGIQTLWLRNTNLDDSTFASKLTELENLSPISKKQEVEMAFY